jgi:hypothetical protein
MDVGGFTTSDTDHAGAATSFQGQSSPDRHQARNVRHGARGRDCRANRGGRRRGINDQLALRSLKAQSWVGPARRSTVSDWHE